MKLIDAMKAQEKDWDTPLPIDAGRCEVHAPTPYSPGYCGERARWLVRGQYRCTKHKESD